VQTGSENSIAGLVNDDSILGSSLGRFRNAVGINADSSTLFLQGDSKRLQERGVGPCAVPRCTDRCRISKEQWPASGRAGARRRAAGGREDESGSSLESRCGRLCKVVGMYAMPHTKHSTP
jgi:hypothetical protein